MPARDTVCVTGGSGGIGQALLERLHSTYRVRVLIRARTDALPGWEGRGYDLVRGDLSDEEALRRLVDGATYVFHCAARIGGPYAESRAVNVDGTRRLARLAAEHGCRRFVHISSVAVYSGAPVESAYTEDLPVAERDDMAVYSRTKLQGETALRDVCRDRGLEFTIIRPTCVYGPRTKSYTCTPIELMSKGLPVMVGSGHGLMDAVYVDDLAEAIVLAAESPIAAGEVFNIGHELVTWAEFYRSYGEMLNRPVRSVPESFLKAAARVGGLFALARSRGALEIQQGVRFLLAAARNTTAYPSSKAQRLLGYEPRVGLPLGMLRTELWARRQGLVRARHHSLNFYGRLPFQPAAVVHPRSESELVEVARLARASRATVRAIGRLHSLSPIPDTTGICVVLDRYDQLVAVEGSLVTVQAGMQLRTLGRALASRGLACPVSGAIAEQTIAGAISTATHGGSLRHGAVSDYVEAVRMVRADGSIVDCDRTHPQFHALVVSLGLLGLLSTVTLRCVPAFRLASLTSVRTAEEVIEHFDEIQRHSEFVDMLYYAVADEFEILSMDRVPQPGDDATKASAPAAGRVRPSAIERAWLRPVALAFLRALSWALLRSTAVQRYATRFVVGSYYKARTGPSHEVLAFQDREGAVRSPRVIRDTELAVPYDQARAALRVLREHFRTTQRFPLMPLHIRCSGRSESWLSPAYGRDVCWIEFWQFPPSDACSERMQSLLEPFGYRFHWGKASRTAPAYIARQYERWHEFLALRRRWDPDGLFANEHLDTFFGSVGDDAATGLVEGHASR
jgi:nucleoside-diphosphate-sugar epimerase/FAD/FMN-containing dehydrogenase